MRSKAQESIPMCQGYQESNNKHQGWIPRNDCFPSTHWSDGFRRNYDCQYSLLTDNDQNLTARFNISTTDFQVSHYTRNCTSTFHT